MAAEMHPEPSDFVEELRKANMSLAGRCLSLPALQDRCDEALRVSLARDLAQRAGDQDVDFAAPDDGRPGGWRAGRSSSKAARGGISVHTSFRPGSQLVQVLNFPAQVPSSATLNGWLS